MTEKQCPKPFGNFSLYWYMDRDYWNLEVFIGCHIPNERRLFDPVHKATRSGYCMLLPLLIICCFKTSTKYTKKLPIAYVSLQERFRVLDKLQMYDKAK